MSAYKKVLGLVSLFMVIFLVGCGTPAKYDYSALKKSNPKSILVLPPINESPDVKAEAAVYSQISFPIAESGYYVFPVALVNETFLQNGLNNAAEIHNVSSAKLDEIFGADAALYVKIKEYGTSYKVLMSESVVTAEANLVDLKTGQTIWSGRARASSAEQSSNSGGGIVGLLVKALVEQVINTTTDKSFSIAGITNQRLVMAGMPNALLHGPRSPNHGKDDAK